MPSAPDTEPVPVAVLLVDPAEMRITWANDVSMAWLAGSAGLEVPGRCVEEVIPVARAIGMYDDMAHVAATGEARHSTSFVMSGSGTGQTFRGSIYRLPDGLLLVLAMSTSAE